MNSQFKFKIKIFDWNSNNQKCRYFSHFDWTKLCTTTVRYSFAFWDIATKTSFINLFGKFLRSFRAAIHAAGTGFSPCMLKGHKFLYSFIVWKAKLTAMPELVTDILSIEVGTISIDVFELRWHPDPVLW